MEMEPQYICPKCNVNLKVGDYIILLGQNRKNEKGLILLHSEIGNYTSIKHPSFKFEPGEPVEFYCPVCHVSLAFDENLSHIILEEKEKSYDIYFSRIAGEESTYVVDGDKVSATGEHSYKYTYFKMDDKFKQYLRR